MRRLLVIALLGAACSRAPTHPDDITLAAYSAPREAFEEMLIPSFQAAWKKQTGRELTVHASYLGSGAQVRAVNEGFPADVVVLALESDVDKIVKAGLISPGWRKRTGNNGFVADTLVVLAVRSGNPEGIVGFGDLARHGLEVLTPNPRTSGGAMWNLLAIYGAALGGAIPDVPRHDPAAAIGFVKDVMKNVIVMDRGARESIVNFERGIGDVAVTYEQEALAARLSGRQYDYVIPEPTILIEIPAAVVDKNAAAHHTSEAATAFVAYLRSAEAQQIFTDYGFRAEGKIDVPVFRIGLIGSWSTILKDLFGDAGTLQKAVEEAQEDR